MKIISLIRTIGGIPNENQLGRLCGWEKGKPQGPWRIYVFPTNRCNLHCKICWQRANTVNKKEEISDERFLSLIDECAEMGARDWIIIGGGEPLIRGNLVMKMCEKIRQSGMTGTLQTNGTLLKPEYAKKLIDIKWDRIYVSIDGPTREINDDIRTQGSFKKATANIKHLAKMKKEQNAKFPIVGLYSTITSTNYDKIDELVDLAHDLGCDDGGVLLTTMILHSPKARRFTLNSEHKVALRENIMQGIKRAASYGMPHNFEIYLRNEIVAEPNAMTKIHNLEMRSGLSNAMCFEPWLTAVINAAGDVGPCCNFTTSKAQNIKNMSFRDIWDGAYLQHVRKQLLNNHPPAYCNICPSILFVKNENLRTYLNYSKMNLMHGLLFMAQKSKKYLLQNGLRRSLNRGFEILDKL